MGKGNFQEEKMIKAGRESACHPWIIEASVVAGRRPPSKPNPGEEQCTVEALR